MGNQIEKCCRNCMKLQTDQFTLETRFMEVTGNFNKSLRCRKFYISSEPLSTQRINELLIFTDSTLTMSIPNFNLRLKDQEIQKLEEAVKYEIYNNNLAIKQNCFVLNAIEQEADSEYDEFKQFMSSKSEASLDKQQQKSQLPNPPQNNKQKLKNQIESFALRNKSRAFRFKNPLRRYPFSHIIVAILPVFETTSDLNALKQAVEQGLSMSEDLKSVAVSEISFMLGYEQSVFQKIILEYILGYSRSRKEYVFKRMNEFFYLTRSQEQINNFLNFLKTYAKSGLEKIDSLETLGSEKDKRNIRKLGNAVVKKVQANDKNGRELNQIEQPINNRHLQKENLKISKINESFGNTSFHSYEGTNFVRFDRQRIKNNSQQQINLSKRSFNHDLSNINDISEIGSKMSDNTDIKNIRIKSFKSKESNVSDYF